MILNRLRGFPIKNPSDFNDFTVAFGWKELPYVGGAAVRKHVTGAVYTTNECPPEKSINFHHEMAHLPKFPSHLFFYCEMPPDHGGETPLCLSNLAYERIKQAEPELVEELALKGVKYTLILPDNDDHSSNSGRGWQSAYMTSSKTEVEELLNNQGYTFTWMSDGCLKTVSPVLPPIRVDPRSGKHTWFNNIVAAFSISDSRNDSKRVVTLGEEGSLLDTKKIENCQRILNASAITFKWKRNDVLLLDNTLVLHARNAYSGNRKVLAAIFE